MSDERLAEVFKIEEIEFLDCSWVASEEEGREEFNKIRDETLMVKPWLLTNVN